MLSIAIQDAPFILIVRASHSEPPTRVLERLFLTILAQKVAHLAQGSLDLITIPFAPPVTIATLPLSANASLL
ncbi:MAG: hypothetical protein IIB14_02925 [Chloroflexi bacterium]|nr:hypothetical protein [Chloroflexota bacterium]